MDPGAEIMPVLIGIVELDEKYVGGKPRYEQEIKHKRGKGTEKQGVLVAVKRNGSVRDASVDSDKMSELCPQVDCFVDKAKHLRTDENLVSQSIGKTFSRSRLGQSQPQRVCLWRYPQQYSRILKCYR
jgi:hypothetical protein